MKTDSDIVMLSAMMTTSMVGIKKLIPMIKEKNPKVKIMIGGAPITEKTVEEYGADITADNAPNALKEAMKMLETLQERESCIVSPIILFCLSAFIGSRAEGDERYPCGRGICPKRRM